MFNFADLLELTALYVLDDRQERAVIRYLRLAQDASLRGDFQTMRRWLDSYVGVLQRVRGTELPAVQADALVQIASSLKTLLSAILETATEYGYLPMNPARGVKFPPKGLKHSVIASADFITL